MSIATSRRDVRHSPIGSSSSTRLQISHEASSSSSSSLLSLSRGALFSVHEKWESALARESLESVAVWCVLTAERLAVGAESGRAEGGEGNGKVGEEGEAILPGRRERERGRDMRVAQREHTAVRGMRAQGQSTKKVTGMKERRKTG